MFLGNNNQIQAEGRGTVTSANNTILVMGVSMTANKMFAFRMAEIDLSLFANLKDNSNLWHMMDGHLTFHWLDLLHGQKMVIGMPSIDHVDDICEGCIYGKHHRASFLVGKAWGATKPLQLAHTNICGAMRALSLNNSKYFLLFIDDHSRKCWVSFLKQSLSFFSNSYYLKLMLRNNLVILFTF